MQLPAGLYQQTTKSTTQSVVDLMKWLGASADDAFLFSKFSQVRQTASSSKRYTSSSYKACDEISSNRKLFATAELRVHLSR